MARAKGWPACGTRGQDTSPRRTGRATRFESLGTVSRVKAMSRLRPPPLGSQLRVPRPPPLPRASLRGPCLSCGCPSPVPPRSRRGLEGSGSTSPTRSRRGGNRPGRRAEDPRPGENTRRAADQAASEDQLEPLITRTVRTGCASTRSSRRHALVRGRVARAPTPAGTDALYGVDDEREGRRRESTPPGDAATPGRPTWWPYWQVILVSDDVSIGLVDFKVPPSSNGDIAIGCAFAPTYRGRGYANEAVPALIASTLLQSPVRYILAETDVTNIRAHRLLQTLGSRPGERSPAGLTGVGEGTGPQGRASAGEAAGPPAARVVARQYRARPDDGPFKALPFRQELTPSAARVPPERTLRACLRPLPAASCFGDRPTGQTAGPSVGCPIPEG